MTPKTQILTLAILAATALAVAGGPTFAQGWGGGPGMGMGGGMGMGRGMNREDAPWRVRFGAIDENKDGVISRDELRAQAEGVFAAMDADNDGRLTLQEYMTVRMGPQTGSNPARQAEMQKRKAARFAPMDTNRDGAVGRDEFIAAQTDTMFRAMDRDGNGRVTPVEFRRHGW